MRKSQYSGYATSTAAELAAAVASRQVSALELFEEAVRVIEAKDRAINAVVVRDFDRAREVAKSADVAIARGESGPLLGVPMTVKESHHVAGLPTSWGLADYKNWTATWDSTGVSRLKAAGAIIVGKTNVPPYLADWQSDNPNFGRTNNPHDLARSPGGSSGGAAAALAAGMVPLELGSDLGGSIRVPAHFCGVYGHKPTWNLVPDTGHTPPGYPGFERPGPQMPLGVVGPLARSASDLELALKILAGPDDENAKAYHVQLPAPRAVHLATLRVLVVENHPLAATDSQVIAALNRVADTLQQRGASISRQSYRLPDLGAQHAIYMRMLAGISSVASRGADDSPPVYAHDWLDCLAAQFDFRSRWAALFEDFDAVIAPPFGTVAFTHSEELTLASRTFCINGVETPCMDQLAWPTVATLPGLPSTVIPAGKTEAGLPVGVQIIGPYLEDLTPIQVAKMLQEQV